MRLPKAELHAHLHGSIRDATLLELLGEAASPAALSAMRILSAEAADDVHRRRSLSECFALFDSIHEAVTSPAAVERITREVVADFAADGVRYLELRTTPRRDVMTAGAYVDAIERALHVNPTRCVVRLLLSINRAQSVAAAEATVDLACERRRRVECGDDGGSHFVVGVDLSGNPTVGDFAAFAPALRRARACGLKITVHCAEVVKPEEVRAIVAFAPDRLGHALHLPRDVVAALLEARIPIEMCPTSNTHTLHLDTLAKHPTLQLWLNARYPISINTDDAGVFATSASEELRRVADAFALSPSAAAALAAAPFAHAFADLRSEDFRAMLADAAADFDRLGFGDSAGRVLREQLALALAPARL